MIQFWANMYNSGSNSAVVFSNMAKSGTKLTRLGRVRPVPARIRPILRDLRRTRAVLAPARGPSRASGTPVFIASGGGEADDPGPGPLGCRRAPRSAAGTPTSPFLAQIQDRWRLSREAGSVRQERPRLNDPSIGEKIDGPGRDPHRDFAQHGQRWANSVKV